MSTAYDEVVAESVRTRRRCLWAGCGVLALALLLGYQLSRSVTHPLRQISLAAERFGAGETEIELPTHARDETGSVARALRQMFDHIQERTTRLKLEIAERKRAELAIQDRTARMQAILDGTTDAIITISATRIVESFNRAAERMFRYRADEVIGQNVRMLMPSPYREEHDQYIRNYLETSIARIIGIGREVVGLRSDATTFPMHLAVSEVKLGDQRFFTGMVRDISHLKQTIEQLTETHHALEERARDLETARHLEVESRGNLEAAQQISLVAESNARDQSARTQAILDGATDAIITDVIGSNVKMLMPAPYRDEHE